jgi:hypothetical protein
MAAQAGLDAGVLVPPWIETVPDLDQDLVEHVALAGTGNQDDGHLRLIDHAELVRDGGRYGLAYLRARRRIRPDDWYFHCHFHGDPVMPGSLGVEAALQGLRLYITGVGLTAGMGEVSFALPVGVDLGWRYRASWCPRTTRWSSTCTSRTSPAQAAVCSSVRTPASGTPDCVSTN